MLISQDIIMQLLTREDVKLNQIDARDPDITDYTTVPDIAYLADRPLGCLDESEELPSDYMNLFELNLFKLDNLALPTVIVEFSIAFINCTVEQMLVPKK